MIEGVELKEADKVYMDQVFVDLKEKVKENLMTMVAELKVPSEDIVDVYYSRLLQLHSSKYEQISKISVHITELLDFYIEAYLRDYEFITPFSKFMILNEVITQEVLKSLKKAMEGIEGKEAKIFEAMCYLSGSSNGFSTKAFMEMRTRISEKLLYKFACSKTFGPSAPRYLYNDEYMGIVSYILSYAFPILLYVLSSNRLLGIERDKEQAVWADLIIVYVEIYAFTHWRKIEEKIRGWIKNKIEMKDID